jgi:DsbE subfamily thiol:disulfide oxidoreductase
MIRLLPILLFSLVAALLFVSLLDKPSRDQERQNDMGAERPMPDLPVYNVQSMEASIPVSDYTGKVTLINFFASWCAPCAAEMGDLVALKKTHPDMQVIGVVWNDSPQNINAWLKKYGNPFDTIRYDPKGRSGMALGLRGIPESYLVDHTGTIRMHRRGVITPEMRTDQIEPFITQLQEEAHAVR